MLTLHAGVSWFVELRGNFNREFVMRPPLSSFVAMPKKAITTAMILVSQLYARSKFSKNLVLFSKYSLSTVDLI